MTVRRSVVAIALIDARGQVLLQLRNPDARVDPSCWTPPGGHLEPGERPEDAVVRELLEETAVPLPGRPQLYWHGYGVGRSRGVEARLYAAATIAGPSDLECREGAALEFCPRSRVAELPLVDLYGSVLLSFLGSPMYYRLSPV